jgi:PPOX class probable F420-dependent enzyme
VGIELKPGVRRLLDRPNIGHLATLQGDGAPKCDPVWVLRDGDRVLVGTGATTIKARNAEHDPRVALSLVDHENPYEEVQLRGWVIDVEPDQDLEVMDRIAEKYTGSPFPFRDGHGRVVLVIEVGQARHAHLPFEATPPAAQGG